jgi:hypothetical protein
MTVVAAIVTRALGGAARLDAGEALRDGPRGTVTRFRVLDGASGAPASVVVKQVAFDHDVHARALFCNEWPGRRS